MTNARKHGECLLRTRQVLASLLLCVSIFLGACETELQTFSTLGRDRAVVISLDKIEVQAGDLVSVSGDGFSAAFKAFVNEEEIGLTIESSQAATFVMPALLEGEFQTVLFKDGSSSIATYTLVDKNRLVKGVANIQASTLCSDVVLTQADGSILRGTRDCLNKAKTCASDGELDCETSEDYPSVARSSIAPVLVSGKTLANVSGTVLPRPEDCSTDGQTGCVTTSSFPSIDLNLIQAGQIKNGVSLGGLTGTLVPIGYPCEADGETKCLTMNGFVSIDKVNTVQANLSNISSTLSLVGLSGTLDDCSTDGEASCIAKAPQFAAAAKVGASAKILSGLTLAGVNGNAAVRPANCSTDGAVTCVTTASFKALDKVSLTASTAKMLTGFTVAGVSGALNNCSSDGQSACVAIGPSYAAVLTTGLQAKIEDGQTFAGVLGSAPARPNDCSEDAETSCVATSSYPAFDITGAAAKIVLGQSVGGIIGSAAGIKPSDCSLDGELACTTNSDYPAMELAGAVAKIAAGDSLGGETGTAGVRPSDCAASNTLSCVATTTFPAIDKNALSLEADKIRTGTSFVGVGGSLGDCASDGDIECVTVSAFPAADKNNSAAKIINTASLAGITGTALPKPANCSADGAVGCVAVNDFPAVDKTSLQTQASKMRSSITLGNVSGTLDDCSSDGETSCVAVTGYVAANATGAAAKILSGQTLAGIGGNAAVRPSDCAAGNQTSCVAVANFPALSTANLTSNVSKIRDSFTLHGTSGTLADCTSDNQNNCVTTAANPAVVAAQVTTGVIKAGSTIAGVTGVYPNASYPLPTGDAFSDLTSANFQASLKAATSFGWFDREGTRYSRGGTTDLAAANLKTAVDVFGEVGTYQGGALDPPVVKLFSTRGNFVTLSIQRPCCLATHALIVRKAGSPTTFTPTNGTSYALSTLGDGTRIFVKNAGTLLNDNESVAGTIYYYTLWSVDANNNYSSSGTTVSVTTKDTASFGSFLLNGDLWYTQNRTTSIYQLPGAVTDGSILLTNGASDQASMIFRPERFTPNMEINFDYALDRDGADGFAFMFGKNFFEEYLSTDIPGGGAVGVLTSGTGYGIQFKTWNTNHINIVDLATNTTLSSTNVPLEGVINAFVSVRITISSNNIKVYLAGSGTPSVDYTHGSNWTISHPNIGFSAATGGATSAIYLRNITVSSF